MNNTTIIMYADGNGNAYTITGTTIEYNPITPEVSSSGLYSGGEYTKKEITPREYTRVKESIYKAIENRSIHIKNRVMGSGFITIRDRDKKTTYRIDPGAKEKEAIEAILTGLVEE